MTTGLDALRDADGHVAVLAVDHRDSLRVYLSPDAPDEVPASSLTEIKIDLVRAVSPRATGVMLEPEYSLPQVIDAGALAPGVGIIAALEAQGYLADPSAAPTRLLEGWSVRHAAEAGAAAAKLLLPYHPDSPLAVAQEAVAAEVLADCRRAGIPLVLEPLFFGLTDPNDRQSVVLRTVERFAGTGADLLKLPFPVDPKVSTDHDEWVDACRRITERCHQPWALLSGGESFDIFAKQTSAAMDGGAAGFMVGRALWGEAARASAETRRRVIDEVVLPRWERLDAIVNERRPTP